MSKFDPERFWQRVDRKSPDECWSWTGAKSGGGHGMAYDGTASTGAHRLAWELTRGPIPKGLYVLHTCDNRPCCNPAHLWLGSQKDNIRDAVRKARHARAGPGQPRGAGHPLAGYKVHQVDEIRRRYAAGGVTQKQLAKEFGVSQSSISQLVTRKRWDV